MSDNTQLEFLQELKTKLIGVFVGAAITMVSVNFLFIYNINSTITNLREEQKSLNSKLDVLTEKIYMLNQKIIL